MSNNDHHKHHHCPTCSHFDFDDEFLEWEEREEDIPYLAHCLAGSVAGITEHVTMLPVDTIKTHMQVHEGKYSAFQTARMLYKTEGLSKFWRGASVLASGCVPAHAVYFTVYETAKLKLLPKFHDKNDQVHPHAYALVGALATSMHDLILTPFDMLKQRSQLAPKGLTGVGSLMAYIVKKEGLLSLYRGYPITLMMNVPQAAAIVSVNETLKILYKPKDGHNIFSYFMCAGIAGSVAAMITIPMDNIKTRLQTQNFYSESRRELEKNSRSSGQVNLARAQKSFFTTVKESASVHHDDIKYHNIIDTTKAIFREEGMRGFYKGMWPRMVSLAPASAISWTAYETLKKLFINKHSH